MMNVRSVMSENQTAYVPLTNPQALNMAPDVKAKIDMGGMSVFTTRRYNWFHRKMIRIMFGWKVTNQ